MSSTTSTSTLRNRPTNNTTRKTVPTATPNVTLKTPTKPLVLDDYLAAVPPESNTYLRQKEKLEHDSAKQLPREAQNLFPTLDDPEFNTKLVQHPEFHVAGELDPAPPKSVEEESNKVCASRDEGTDDDQFLEHQLFVRNFLTPTSPYNSLLLYHSATANKWCAAIGVAEEWRRQHHSGGGTTTTVFTTTKEDADSFQKTLFQPSMLEQIGDRVVAKWGCATEGLLRDVNPTNAAVPMAQLVQDIQQLIAKSYHIVQVHDLLSGNHPSPPSFVIIDNIPTPLPPKLTEMLSTKKPGTTSKILLLYSFPMLEKPQEIVELVNLMNANDGRGLIEANEVFDPRRSNKFVEAHKENGHYVQESGEDLLRRKLNGYVSFLRSETPYTHALRLYPDVFAPDRVFRESTTLWQTLGKLVSSLSMQPVTKPVEYPTQQIHGQPFAVDASGGSQRLRHLPLYLTHLGEEQERTYEEMLKNTKPGVSMTPLLEALTMTYPKPAMSSAQETATFDSLMMETNGSYEYRFPADRIFAPDRLPKYSGKLAEICRILGTVKASRVLIVSFSNMVPLALALEEYGFIRVGGDALLRQQPGTPTTPQKKTLSSYSLGFSAEADIVLLTDSDATTTKHRNIRQIHFLDPPPHMNRLEQIIATAIYPRSHCGLPFSKRNVEIYMHASVSNASPREQADVFAYRTVYESARAIGRVTRLMKEVAVDSLFAPRDYSMSQFENNKIKIQLPTQDSVMEFVAGDRPYSAVCDYMEKCTLPQWASAPRRATLQALLLEQPPIESRVTQRIRQLFQEKTIYKRTDLLAAVQRPRMFSLEKVVKELSRLISEKSDVMYDQYGRRGYLVLRGDVYAFQPVEITDTHSGEFERTVPVEMKPVTVSGGGLPRFKQIIEDVQLKVDVASGDSQISHPWYEHVQDWFNELQLVHHMTASEIRDYVVDHAIDVMSEDEQRVLLTTMYETAGQKTKSSVTEKRIRKSLDRRMLPHHDENVLTAVVRLGPRAFQQQPEKGTWITISVKNDNAAKNQLFLDENGHLHVGKTKKTLNKMRKSDLFHLLEQSSLNLPIHVIRNRNVSVHHVVVWVEMLLRHSKQL